MAKKQYRPRNSDTQYETEEYEEVLRIDDNYNNKQQLEQMNELFRQSYANLNQIKSKLENLEHYSSKLCLAKEAPCSFYNQVKCEGYAPMGAEGYYHDESRPQYTNISPHDYTQASELTKTDLEIHSDPSDTHSNVIPSERIIIDLTPQNVDGSGGVSIKHTSNTYAYTKQSQQNSVNLPKTRRQPNEATFYVMNDTQPHSYPVAQPPRHNSYVKQPYYSQPNKDYTPSLPPPPVQVTKEKKKKKSSLFGCCKK